MRTCSNATGFSRGALGGTSQRESHLFDLPGHESGTGTRKHRLASPSNSQSEIKNPALEHCGRWCAEARRKTGDLSTMRGVQGKAIGSLRATRGIYNDSPRFQAGDIGAIENISGFGQKLRPESLLQGEERSRIAQVKLINVRAAESVPA